MNLESLINELKEWNIFLAANLNSSELWTKESKESGTLYHLVIALENEHLIDISSDSYNDLLLYVGTMMDFIRAGDETINWKPVDIRKGKTFVRQDKNLVAGEI